MKTGTHKTHRPPRSPPADEASDARAVAKGLREILEGRRELFTFEYPCHAPHQPRWFLLTASPLSAERFGGRRGAVITHIDITERMEGEQSLRRRAGELAAMARQLKRANEQLDQFAYVTSHDLRRPLRGIANLSTWIEEDMGERFTPEAHQQMELLRGRVHRMEAMINGILEYSRAGRVRVPPEKIDVAQLLAEVVDLLDPPANFTVDVAAGMPEIFGQRLRLQQVFQNLIGNAIKHHDAGKDPAKPRGTVRVRCRDAGAGPERAGGFCEFEVADDGPGIERQYHDKIFVIFQTLQSRDKVEGTGVGLALVKKIVESEGGTISVDSAPGAGTTFRFTWPRTVEVPAEDARKL